MGTPNRDLVGFSSSSSHHRGQNHLLIIGIDRYQSVGTLRNARRDGEALRELLQAAYQFEPERTHTLYDQAASLGEIIRTFRSLIEGIPQGDNLLFYFAGHGHYDQHLKEGYLIPVDAAFDQLDTYLPYATLQTLLRGASHLHHIFFIIDACYSGAVLVQGRNALQRALESEPSRWVLASGRNEVVPDGMAGDHSPFATELLELLSTHQEHGIHSARLIDRLTENVFWNSHQTPIGEPMFGVGHKGGQFVFHPKGGEAADQPRQDEPLPPQGLRTRDQSVTPLPKKTPIKQPVQQLIARANPSRALRLLADWTAAHDSEAYISVVALQGRMAQLTRQQINGVLTQDQENTQQAKISRDILELVRDLP